MIASCSDVIQQFLPGAEEPWRLCRAKVVLRTSWSCALEAGPHHIASRATPCLCSRVKSCGVPMVLPPLNTTSFPCCYAAAVHSEELGGLYLLLPHSSLLQTLLSCRQEASSSVHRLHQPVLWRRLLRV